MVEYEMVESKQSKKGIYRSRSKNRKFSAISLLEIWKFENSETHIGSCLDPCHN